MSKANSNPAIEAMEESGEHANNITPPTPMAIQRARTALLLSSLRRATLLRSTGACADLDTEDIVKLKRRVVNLSAEISSQRHHTERLLNLRNLEGILGFVSFCLFLLLIALE